MNDSTIIKPRPGALQSPRHNSANGLEAHRSGPMHAPEQPQAISHELHIPTTRSNPLVDAASHILSLAGYLRQLQTSPMNIQALRRQCVSLLHGFTKQLDKVGYTPASSKMASYSLCALLDETILNQDWGRNSEWSQQSLLSDFHSETWAGTHFFEIVDRALQSQDSDLLQLLYLCLAMGFKGKYRVEKDGSHALDTLMADIFQKINHNKPHLSSAADLKWQKNLVAGRQLTYQVPLWSVFTLCGAVMAIVYISFVLHLQSYAEPLYQQLARIGSAPTIASAPPDHAPLDQAYQYLDKFLKTEINSSIISLEILPDRIRLRLTNDALFASGSADINEEIKPVLMKISRALEGTSGKILITGHTDDQRIYSNRYPSNWHLSLDRATQVSNYLAVSADLKGRLWPEGRGSSDPVTDNLTEVNRAQNRRIDIELLANF